MKHKSNLTYEGQVTIKVKGKTRYKGKNTGTVHLFEVIYGVLSQTLTTHRQTDLVDCLPGYITIVNCSEDAFSSDYLYNDSIKNNSCILNEMPIITRSYDSSSLNYSCLLNSSNIKSLSGNPLILLLNGKKTKILAYLTFFDTEIVNMIKQDPVGQAEITWSMTISNEPKSS